MGEHIGLKLVYPLHKLIGLFRRGTSLGPSLSKKDIYAVAVIPESSDASCCKGLRLSASAIPVNTHYQTSVIVSYRDNVLDTGDGDVMLGFYEVL